MHLVSLAVSARLRGRGEPPAQAWELMRQCGEVSSSRSWQAGLRFKPQPCVRRSARLIRAVMMPASHGVIVPPPPAGLGRCAPSAPTARCSGPAWPPRGTPPCRPALRGWPGRPARTCTRWMAASHDRPGPGPDSAPTRSPRRSRGSPSWTCWSAEAAQPPVSSFCLIHLCPGAVHWRPPRSCSGRSRTADIGERGPALLESVLGATPPKFESPILRHADLQEHR